MTTTSASSLEPPVAPRRPSQRVLHGETVDDDYAWLRQRDDEATLAYLEAENRYTAAVMAPLVPLQERLYDEFVSRLKETDAEVPYRYGRYEYYQRTVKGLQYEIYCRRRVGAAAGQQQQQQSDDEEEQVLLDLNAMAAEHKLEYLEVGFFEVSPDHRMVANGVDTLGSERYRLQVLQLNDEGQAAPRLLESDQLVDVESCEWADNATLFYLTMDDANRPNRLWRHRLGEPQSADRLVLEEPDDMFRYSLSSTRSQRFLLLSCSSAITSEVRFLDLLSGGGGGDGSEAAHWRVFAARRHAVEYSLSHHGDHFYLLSNEGPRPNARLLLVPVATYEQRDSWREVLPHDPLVRLLSVSCWRRFAVVSLRRDGMPQLQLLPVPGGGEWAPQTLAFDDELYSVDLGDNADYELSYVRVDYESMISPRTIYDVHVDLDAATAGPPTLRRELRKRYEVQGAGFDSTQYRTERLWATVPAVADEATTTATATATTTRVPISIVYPVGHPRDGSGRLWLYGYGAYEVSIDPNFNPQRLSALQRGVAFAIAHPRGGGEMGRLWYEHGKMMHKRNTFLDFIACADALVAGGWSRPEHMVVSGRSAGGLLMGGVLTLRPDIAAGALVGVPFVDVVNTLLDRTIPLTAIEFEEWGDPSQPDAYRYMRSYSPYENIRPGTLFPELLITGGLNDKRVCYWEPAKLTARLRQLAANRQHGRRLILKMEMGAGHFSKSGRYDHLRETAIEYSFLLSCLGIQ